MYNRASLENVHCPWAWSCTDANGDDSEPSAGPKVLGGHRKEETNVFYCSDAKKTCYLANSNLQFEQIHFPAVNDSEPGAGVVAGRRGRLGREEAVQVTPTPKTGFRPFDAAPDIKLSEPQKGIDVQVAKKGIWILEMKLFCRYTGGLLAGHVSHSLGGLKYIAIYRIHSAGSNIYRNISDAIDFKSNNNNFHRTNLSIIFHFYFLLANQLEVQALNPKQYLASNHQPTSEL